MAWPEVIDIIISNTIIIINPFLSILECLLYFCKYCNVFFIILKIIRQLFYYCLKIQRHKRWCNIAAGGNRAD